MLKVIPDYLKTKKMCKNGVKKLPFVINYVPNQYKTQEICDKVILENDRTLKFVPDCNKKKRQIVLRLLTIMFMR